MEKAKKEAKKAEAKKDVKKDAKKKAVKALSQKALVLKFLEGHKGGLTKAVALEKLGCKRLSAVVSELKKEGHKIECEKVAPKKGEPYFVYKLVK
jgi:hypothetical protein